MMSAGRHVGGHCCARIARCAGFTVIAALTGMALATEATAANVPLDSSAPSEFITEGNTRHVLVTVNKSLTISIKRRFAKVIVGSADIADVLPASDQKLYIQGKKIGTTNISIFDDAAQLIGIIDVEVTLDTVSLQQKIQASLGIGTIRVSSSGGRIILTGMAPDTVAADRAIAVARGLVGDAVVNAMQVAPAQQVMLEVRFLEVSRSAARHLGVNWFGKGPGGLINSGRAGNGPPIAQAGPGQGACPFCPRPVHWLALQARRLHPFLPTFSAMAKLASTSW